MFLFRVEIVEVELFALFANLRVVFFGDCTVSDFGSLDEVLHIDIDFELPFALAMVGHV